MIKRRSIALMLITLIFFSCFNWNSLNVKAASKEMSYTFAELEMITEWGVSSNITSEGELEITFDGQYQSQFYAIPSDIDSSTIEKLVFDVTSGNAGDLAFKLHTQEDFDSDNKEGTPVSYGYPEVIATVEEVLYFSVMSLNGGTTEATISGVTFYIDESKDGIDGDSQTNTEVADDEEIPSLKDTYVADFGDDMIAGVAITLPEITDKKLMGLVTKHFNGVTLGNELKPDALFGYSNSKCPGTETVELNGEMIEVPLMDYRRAEKILDYIYDWNQENPDNIIKVRGHVLVWHSQTPEWFFHEDYDKTKPYVTPEVMNQRLEWYIKTVLTHFTGEDSKYKGMFYGWDVVNEAISDSTGTYRSDIEGGNDNLSDDTHGNKSSWWAVYKSNEFIINAFKYANMYAPADLELYYNDYNDSTPTKVEPICELLKAVKDEEGTRIDGMGMQAHYMMDSPSVDQYLEAARAYAEIVGEVQFTEFDIRASRYYDGTDATLEDEYLREAYRYKELYDAMMQLDAEGINIGGMTVWGVIDPNSWLQSRSNVGGGADGKQAQCPLFFDGDYQAKPCFWAIVDSTKLGPKPEDILASDSVKQKTAMNIVKGTVTVDGEKDEAWDAAAEVNLGIVVGSKDTAIARVLWDENYLYVYANVVDSDLNAANQSAHEQDSLEIFVDENNTKATSYNTSTKQYRINFENALSFNGETCKEENIISATKITEDGYIVEAAIKWTELTATENMEIGIELQINDADSSGARIGTLNLFDTTNDCWENPSNFGTAILVSETSKEIEPIIGEAVSSNSVKVPAGVSTAAMAVVALGICGIGAYALKKSKEEK